MARGQKRSRARKRSGGRPPDVEIGASVRARKLRFKNRPQTETALEGVDRSSSERENLPDEVEPGVTYRDVRVRWRLAAAIEDREEADGDRRDP
jgi:hypothetical protein